MEFGCHVPVYGNLATRENVIAFAREMESLAFDSLWVRDHVVLPWSSQFRYPYRGISPGGEYPVSPRANLLEPLTTLALVAGVTERVRLGTTVLVLPLRHPVLSAKILATLDHLSNGRVIAGVGVGWMGEEIELFGVPFERRGAWSDEAIRIMRLCWSEERVSYRGEFFQFDDIACFPKPVKKGIPIWIGGNTPRAIRRAAELGDGWHPAFASPEELERGVELLRAECGRLERRFGEVAITMRTRLSICREKDLQHSFLEGTFEEIIDRLRRYKALGVQTIILEARYEDLGEALGVFREFAESIRVHV